MFCTLFELGIEDNLFW